MTRAWGLLTGDRNAGYSMSLPDRAGQVLDLMVQKHFGERPLLFICHSLGGLLVKQILRKADDAVDPRKKQVAEQTRAVLFLATPHAGAELASLVTAFRTVFGATVSMEDLRLHDTHLRDLFDWYRNQSVVLGIQTETYYEMHGIKGVLPIVNPTSAHPGVGADPVPLDEDHLSIAKPSNRDEQVCDAARYLLRDYVLAPRSTAPLQEQSASALLTPEPPRVIVQVQGVGAGTGTLRIPCELPPAAEKHFGRQTELKRLTDRLLSGKSSAVVGPAGIGKTALAAEAVCAAVGDSLATSPFPDGVVFLDLYTYRGQADPAWNNLANALGGPGFMDTSPARERATEASRARRALIIIEGGEEADGENGRTTIEELCRVFSSQNRILLLTRLSTQTVPSESVELKEALHPGDAADLLDSLTQGRVKGAVRDQVLALVEGHPLALTWAGGLLARDDDDPERLVIEWKSDELPSLRDPKQAEHTLKWLFNRSVRGLDDVSQKLLSAAGLLARAPLPLAAMLSALEDQPESASVARTALKSLVQRGLLRRSEEADHWQFTHVLGYGFARNENHSDTALHGRLGRWLSGHLRAITATSLSQKKIVLLTRSLEHASALLRADPDQRLWIPLANDLLYDIGRRLTSLGRLDMESLALGALDDWLGRFPLEKAQTPKWLRERSCLLTWRGDLLRSQGDLAGSSLAYRSSLDIDRQLAEADPSNTSRQRDLSVSEEKIGEVLHDQGDLDGALKAFSESLAVMRSLAEADPSNAAWQCDLSGSHSKVGNVLRGQGDLDGALTAYRESLAVMRRLAQDDPSNDNWKRDLGVSHIKVGDVLRDQGDLDGSLTEYRESLAVVRPLAEADPSNAGWQRDLSVSQERIGDRLLDQGDLDGALTAFRDPLVVRRRLAEADPSNAGWQRDLSYILVRLAKVQDEQGNRGAALLLAEESLEINERLAALDRTNVTWQKDVAARRALVVRLRGL